MMPSQGRNAQPRPVEMRAGVAYSRRESRPSACRSSREVSHLPLAIPYPAHGSSSVSGQGSNASGIGYTVRVDNVVNPTGVEFGVFDSDIGQGVPWDDASGRISDRSVSAFAIDVDAASTHKGTITFDSPVASVRFAIADLDAEAREQPRPQRSRNEAGDHAENLRQPAPAAERELDRPWHQHQLDELSLNEIASGVTMANTAIVAEALCATSIVYDPDRAAGY